MAKIKDEIPKYGQFDPNTRTGTDASLVHMEDASFDKMIAELKANGYEIPDWCNMSIWAHYDGMGGCWGITGEYVKKKGKTYCVGCEYCKGQQKLHKKRQENEKAN